MIIEEEDLIDDIENGSVIQNGGMLALAEAVDDPHLSLEEAGAAEDLLALASEASASFSFSNPVYLEESNVLPFKNNENGNLDSNETETSSDINIMVPVPERSRSNPSLSNRKHVCHNCAATSTPFWRKSGDGHYYCNACGLYLRTHNAMRPLTLSKNRETRRSKLRPEACGNCGASDTPMWRKTEDGLVVCNACGLYHKLHSQHRQIGNKRHNYVKPDIESSSGEVVAKNSPAKKQGSRVEFTMARENSIVTGRPGSTPAITTKYSLDPQFHHKFDPNRQNNVNGNKSIGISTSTSNGNSSIASNSVVFPITVDQPLDVRKLAYLKSSQGRTALLAPKLINPSGQSSTTSPPLVPPILTDFINSLASTSSVNLPLDQSGHPLQPLLTSIVSQKLREQRKRVTTNATSSEMSNGCVNVNDNIQAMQQQGYTADYWSPTQFSEFTQIQQSQHHQQAIYNQQMMYNHQQALSQSQSQSQVQTGHDFPHINGYNFGYSHSNLQSQTQQFQQVQSQANQFIHQHSGQYQGQQYSQYYPDQQQIQNSHDQAQTLPHPQPRQFNHQQDYFIDHQFSQFPEIIITDPSTKYPAATAPITRQLSPFSALKFDKNLIDIVNMQFWQEQEPSEEQYQYNFKENNHNNNNNSDDSSFPFCK